MWLKQPIWMMRYHLSSWLMLAALRVLPASRYRAELQRRVYGLRDEVIVEVLAHRATNQQ